jgi:hypothetical protein
MMTQVRTFPAWQAFSMHQPGMTSTGFMDIGLITLDRNIGDQTGWMSYTFANDGTFAPGTIVSTAGYPADGGYDGYSMQFSTGPIAGLSPDGSAIQYYQSSVTAYAGQSGSPVWIGDLSTNSIAVYGIHVGGDVPEFATRITSTVFDTLQTWRAADASTPPPTPTPTPTRTPTPTPAPTPSPTPTLTPPDVIGIGPVWHSKAAITSIGVNFNAPLNPASARDPNHYRVLASVTKRVKGRKVTVFQALRIKRVTLSGDMDFVRIYLTAPHRGLLLVIVRPGIVGASGAVNSTGYNGSAH